MPCYNVPAAVATDNCSNPIVTYAITGATNRSGSGKNASGFFNPGVSTITWSAKDAAGNVSTCTSVITINKIIVNIPDVYTVAPGGNANTVYLGYGPSSITLTAKASGGTAPYTYQWSNGATTPSITLNPSSSGIYTYMVAIKDAAGCMSFDIHQVKVTDVRCGNKLDKITVCHVPPGNPRNAGEICISRNAVPDHIAHGDKLGSCSDRDDDRDDHLSKQTNVLTLNKMSGSSGAFPNPTRGRFEITVSTGNTGAAQVLVMNANGTVVDRRNVMLTTKGQVLSLDLTGKPAGVYLVKIISKGGSQTEKIIVQQ